ncbi:MAG: MarR family transcriptional regulator [Anaerolineales bacterium]|jgi:DNA-binding MarR family transcriptional regulator
MHSDDPFVNTLGKWIEVFMRRSMHNFITYSKEKGLSMSQIGALLRIFRGGRSSVSDIGDNLGVTSAAASQMLERLVQQGLILREEDPNDRRVRRIVLTDKGRQILNETIAARQGWLESLAQTLSDGERERVTEALNILIEKADQLEQPSQPVRP